MPSCSRMPAARQASATGQPALRQTRRFDQELMLRVVPWAYLTVAVALVPWIVFLSLTLPSRTTVSHYRLAWVGFDTMLLVAFARTAYLTMRRRVQTEIAAAATATMLLVDAWFDMTTASTHGAFVEAVVLAVFGEVPAALFSILLVRFVNRAIASRLSGATPGAIAPPGSE